MRIIVLSLLAVAVLAGCSHSRPEPYQDGYRWFGTVGAGGGPASVECSIGVPLDVSLTVQLQWLEGCMTAAVR